MAPGDAQWPATLGAARLDKFCFPQAQHLAARNARIGDPATEADNEHKIGETWPQDRNDGDGEQDRGKGQLHIGERHNDIVAAPTDIARHHPQDNAQCAPHHHCGTSHHK